MTLMNEILNCEEPAGLVPQILRLGKISLKPSQIQLAENSIIFQIMKLDLKFLLSIRYPIKCEDRCL